jgi:hypothetical protein
MRRISSPCRLDVRAGGLAVPLVWAARCQRPAYHGSCGLCLLKTPYALRRLRLRALLIASIRVVRPRPCSTRSSSWSFFGAGREQALIAKLDRGYEDYVSARISDAFWERKSQEWETELQEVRAERARIEPPRRPLVATAAHILELAKQAEFLYQTQDPREQRRLLETVLSNCSFDRGTLCPTYSSPFDLLVRGNETGDWRALQDSNLRPPGS